MTIADEAVQPVSNPPELPVQCGDTQATRHMEQAILSGRHWYLAMLEAMALWESARECHNGRTYIYLIAGEAFDWLLLAERLCMTVDRLLPSREKIALLFHGKAPIEVPAETLRELIGETRYHQYLNYHYGVTVEEALLLAVQEEVRKEWRSTGIYHDKDATTEACRRIYGSTRAILLRWFRRERDYPHTDTIGLSEMKEFTYWLFKYRVKQCDKARVASDTRKALCYLNTVSPTAAGNRVDCGTPQGQ